MGNDSTTYVHGEIAITPPAPAPVLAGSRFTAETAWAADSEVFAVPDQQGRYASIKATSPDGATRAPQNLVEHVNAIIDLIGPGHTLTGELYCEGPGVQDIWQVRVVDGRAVAEDAVVVFPGDCAVPAGPAVTFDPSAARAWLSEHVTAGGGGLIRAGQYAIDVAGVYDAASGDLPADWVERLVHAFAHGAAPQVWRTAAGLAIEVVETCDAQGVADGGAVLVVEVGGARLACRRLAADELTRYEYDERGRATKPRLDAVIEALTRAVEEVNALLDGHRTRRVVDAHTLAGQVGGVRFGHVNFHTPGVKPRDAVVGRWTFVVAGWVADFATAWQAAIEVFRADPQVRALAALDDYSLNYGDLIEHGAAILARHGLTLLPDVGDEVTVDHDEPLFDGPPAGDD